MRGKAGPVFALILVISLGSDVIASPATQPTREELIVGVGQMWRPGSPNGMSCAILNGSLKESTPPSVMYERFSEEAEGAVSGLVNVGVRTKSEQHAEGLFRAPSPLDAILAEKEYTRWILVRDSSRKLAYVGSPNGFGRVTWIIGSLQRSGEIKFDVACCADSSILRGFIPGDLRPIYSLLRDAASLEVQSDTGSETRIRFQSDGGSYELTLDRSRGFAILRAEVTRAFADAYGGEPLWVGARRWKGEEQDLPGEPEDYDMLCEANTVVEYGGFELVNGDWLPSWANCRDELRRGEDVLMARSLDVRVISRGPVTAEELEELKNPKIPDGVEVVMWDGAKQRRLDGVPRVWQGGRPVVKVEPAVVEQLDAAVESVRSQPSSVVGKEPGGDAGWSVPLVVGVVASLGVAVVSILWWAMRLGTR